MSDVHLSAHAVMRMSQRGVGVDDIALVEWIGTEVEGGYLVLQKDFRALDRELKKLREQARRLVGKRIVRDGGMLVTVYHARRGKQRRLLRGAEERSLNRCAGRH